LDSLQNNVSGVTRRMITLENTLSGGMRALEAQRLRLASALIN
jgi:hypothetical protein